MSGLVSLLQRSLQFLIKVEHLNGGAQFSAII